jgi:hypothetical protein
MSMELLRVGEAAQGEVFSYLSPESRVRKDHPLRTIRMIVDEILGKLSPEFDRMYARQGRTIDCTREAFTCAVAADAVFGA